MGSIVDIECPNCGEVRNVRKVSVGQYRCEECGTEFTAADVKRS